MTEDTLIELAKQAGFLPDIGIPVHPSTLFHFAALVAAAEREACAKVCDERATKDGWEGSYAHRCAIEIRSRK